MAIYPRAILGYKYALVRKIRGYKKGTYDILESINII